MWKVMQDNLEDLTNPGLWRALAAEFLGTMFLVLLGCGAIDNNGSSSSVVQVALAFGLIFGSMVWCFNHVSGGHINPAITVAALVCRRVSIVRAILYVICQCVGGIAGAGILYGVSNSNSTSLGVNTVAANITATQGFVVEMLITFVLVFVVLASTDEKRSDLAGSAPLSIGLAVAVGHLFAFQYTTASMNPGRSFGPAIIQDYWADHWVFWVGPIVGGILAAIFYEYIFAAGATFSRTRKFVLRSRKPAKSDKEPAEKEELNSSKAGLIEIQMEEKDGEASIEMEKVEEEEKKEEEPATEVKAD